MMLMAPFFVNYFVTILLFLLILNIAIFGAKFGIKKDVTIRNKPTCS